MTKFTSAYHKEGQFYLFVNVLLSVKLNSRFYKNNNSYVISYKIAGIKFNTKYKCHQIFHSTFYFKIDVLKKLLNSFDPFSYLFYQNYLKYKKTNKEHFNTLVI